jgi:hypothetical protein
MDNASTSAFFESAVDTASNGPHVTSVSDLRIASLSDVRDRETPNGSGTVFALREAQQYDPKIAKLAGRASARQTSVADERALLKEREALLRKQMTSQLSKAEARRLEFVRWGLARIEDARIGPTLDELELAVRRYEDFLSEITRLRQELNSHTSTKNR